MFIVKIILSLILYQAIGIAVSALLPSLSMLMALGLSAAVSIPVMYALYQREQKKRPPLSASVQKMEDPLRQRGYFIALITGACTSLTLNLVIALSPIPQLFPQWEEQLAPQFYNPPLWQQILCTGIAAPAAEEILFRGQVFGLLKDKLPWKAAAVISALIFAICHGNMVQGVYAFAMGLILAWLAHRFQDLSAPVLFHAGANLWAVAATNMAVSGSESSPLLLNFIILEYGLGFVGCYMGLRWFWIHLKDRRA